MKLKKTKCQHQLFDYEADYVICPACGEPIAENMLADPNFKLQVIRRSRKYKRFLRWKKGYFFFLFLALLIVSSYLYLDHFIIKAYGITGIDSFNPASKIHFYPFKELSHVEAFLMLFLAGPHIDRREWLNLWHLQKHAYILQASWFYLFFRVIVYILLIYFGNTVWRRLVYLSEMDTLRLFLSGESLIYASEIYSKVCLYGLYIILSLYFLMDCWLFFYQRLAIRVNRF
ncbi:hypothetical protein ACVRXQ_00645 [Streptococcus panodentis]|uniref:DUF3667 domain-containing protein n=1 Tax=Streptococcus panodentis TaxID=1581472 RepID=A0ABS5ATJ9_9STRE|nr:hypothetical protein [Streptococcus panodentis]MBP2619902.1 hypothetical protein [Streptococcus panodentis]